MLQCVGNERIIHVLWICVVQYVAVCCRQENRIYPTNMCITVCCSVLQCVTVCCSVLQCVVVCCSMLQHVAVRCRVLKM